MRAALAMRSCALLFGLVLSVQAGAQERGALCIDSTFIQLWSEHLAWPQDRWRLLFASMHRLGIREVVVQWSALDNERFFLSSKSQPSPVETILLLARKHRMRVVMGLSHDTRHWERIARPDLAPYLAERAQHNAVVLDALAPIVRKNRTVSAWYVSEEIDDLNWNDPAAHALLKRYLQDLSRRMAASKPSRPVSISAFANAGTRPDELAQQWKRRLRDNRVLKRLYFQDGIGVGKLSLEGLPAYYEALRRETGREGVELVPVVETFTQVAGAPLNDQPYAAQSAPLPRLQVQIQAARRAGKVSSFGVPEYLSPVGAGTAAQAYSAWISLLDSRNEGCEKK